MTTPMLDFVVDRLGAEKGRWPTIAKDSNVPLRSLEKIARRETPNPGINNVQLLATYFGFGHSKKPR